MTAEQSKEYYAANRERVLARCKAYYLANVEAIKVRNKAYYEANKEWVKARYKNRKQNQPVKPEYTKEQKAYIARARNYYGKEWRQHVTEADIESIVTDADKYNK